MLLAGIDRAERPGFVLFVWLVLTGDVTVFTSLLFVFVLWLSFDCFTWILSPVFDWPLERVCNSDSVLSQFTVWGVQSAWRGVSLSVSRGVSLAARYAEGSKPSGGKLTILWDLTHRPLRYWNLFRLMICWMEQS